jgi:hypothetical protein
MELVRDEILRELASMVSTDISFECAENSSRLENMHLRRTAA